MRSASVDKYWEFELSANDYIGLTEAYKNTKGFEVFGKLLTLKTSLTVFHGNHHELRARLEFHATDMSSHLFDGMGNKSARDREFYELTRLLHNYVASVGSLVDHTRRISKHVLCSKDFREYQGKVDLEFKNDPITSFLKDLRNAFLHSEHLPPHRTTRFEPDRIVSRGIEFSAKRLQEAHDWQVASISFMQSYEDGIPLIDVILKYEQKVGAFYAWLIEFIQKCRASDMEEFWKKHDIWVAFCKSESIPTTEEEFREFAEKEQADFLKSRQTSS